MPAGHGRQRYYGRRPAANGPAGTSIMCPALAAAGRPPLCSLPISAGFGNGTGGWRWRSCAPAHTGGPKRRGAASARGCHASSVCARIVLAVLLRRLHTWFLYAHFMQLFVLSLLTCLLRCLSPPHLSLFSASPLAAPSASPALRPHFTTRGRRRRACRRRLLMTLLLTPPPADHHHHLLMTTATNDTANASYTCPPPPHHTNHRHCHLLIPPPPI